MTHRAQRPFVLLLSLLVLLASCTGSEQAEPLTNEFDDHTVQAIASVLEYQSLAAGGTTQSTVKFVIPDMLNSNDVYWMDSNFYQLHDEWYWFRLINGQSAPASGIDPVGGLEFETVQAVYDWGKTQAPSDLPLDLRFVGEDQRLYSPNFYRLALDPGARNYGVGSLVNLDDHWLIELEYTDHVTAEEIPIFFERLSQTLPREIGDRLEWVLRSPEHEATAAQMIQNQAPFHDRIIRYSELVEPGTVAVYNPGVAAGRLLLVEPGEHELTDATQNDILLVNNVPDWLPPASAVISSGPQTPLAHVNLLARNRGIPNASQAGILSDPQIRQAARVRAPAAVRATGDGELQIELITEDQYATWRQFGSQDAISVPPVDLADMPTVIDLTALAATIETEADIDALRPTIGGKSAGFLTLLEAEGVTTPLTPLAITVRPYAEHLNRVQTELDAMLANPKFRSSARARYLFLEGPKDYAELYTSEADVAYAASIAADNGPETSIGKILEAGGFKDFFRDVDMNTETLAEITTILEQTYGDYATPQGIRFRSSSSVEDIEGFSGAGLYDSNTGFLYPEAQEEGDQKKSIEYTLKKTWASYWSFEAFEERRLESVVHTSGAMGVLVHSRFDDALEVNNGVATFSLGPDGWTAAVNVQAGEVSVANPDAETLPEIVEIKDGIITRLAESSLVSPGTDVLTDAAVEELVTQLESATSLWLTRLNTTLPQAQRSESVTLDFEFKTMAAGWPAFADGTQLPSRLVVKQARSLDPGLRGVPDEVRNLPVPRDVLAYATAVERVDCAVSETSSTARFEIFMGNGEILLVPAPIPVEPDAECERTVLLSSPERFLTELLDL